MFTKFLVIIGNLPLVVSLRGLPQDVERSKKLIKNQLRNDTTSKTIRLPPNLSTQEKEELSMLSKKHKVIITFHKENTVTLVVSINIISYTHFTSYHPGLSDWCPTPSSSEIHKNLKIYYNSLPAHQRPFRSKCLIAKMY